MEFLFLRLCEILKAEGCRWFDLGMAPLSGLSASEAAPFWHRLGGAIYEEGVPSYNFKGLRGFKSKLQPVWRPRYLAIAGGGSPALLLLDATRLIGRATQGDQVTALRLDFDRAWRRGGDGRRRAGRRLRHRPDPASDDPAARRAGDAGESCSSRSEAGWSACRRRHRRATCARPARRWSASTCRPTSRRSTTSSKDCVYLVADFERLGPRARARERRHRRFHAPLVAGAGEGGALAIDILAQTPADTLGGAIAVDPAAGQPLKTDLCTKAARNAADGGGSVLQPARRARSRRR